MTRFVVGDDRSQSTLFPERLDDYLGEDNPVRAIDFFVDELDLAGLGFGGVEPETTGRPAYHPATLLKIYVYGTSIGCNRAGASNGSASATSSWCG
jgi:transposase